MGFSLYNSLAIARALWLKVRHVRRAITVGWVILDRTTVINFAGRPGLNYNAWGAMVARRFSNRTRDMHQVVYGIARRRGKTTTRPKVVRKKPGGYVETTQKAVK